MSRKEFQEMLFGASALPTRQEAFSYTEAINPDSLHDAFEVENDCIDRIFNQIK